MEWVEREERSLLAGACLPLLPKAVSAEGRVAMGDSKTEAAGMNVPLASTTLHQKQSREGDQQFWRSIYRSPVGGGSKNCSEQHCAGRAGAPE